MVVDDFKKIIRILECHVDSISNDLCFLNQFPLDPGVNLFMVTPNGRPLVVRLQPRTSIHALLLVKIYTFRFWVLSYIRRTIGIIHKDINHHNLLVDFHAPLVNLCDWDMLKLWLKDN